MYVNFIHLQTYLLTDHVTAPLLNYKDPFTDIHLLWSKQVIESTTSVGWKYLSIPKLQRCIPHFTEQMAILYLS